MVKILPKINVLEKHLAELIAAGEVVERPCSVVKELLENSIDAGATNIVVEIIDGGNTFIRVTDDGCGIEKEDIPKAFLRHATSKIHDEFDLDRILTFGFRGEALASISAVSKVEIMTRTKGANIGYRCEVTDEGTTEIEEAGCPEGTTLVIRDLFYNIPARQKFLKKDVTEANAVAQVVDKIALSHPEIKFRFIREGEVKLITYGTNDLLSVISSVYGREFAKDCIEVNYTSMGRGIFKIHGYITKPSASKGSKAFQTFFVNGRFVKTGTGSAAIEEAYKGSAMVGKHPGCILNIEIPPEAVDVNVHPAKTEVRFINEKDIFDLVYYGVKNALDSKDVSAVVQESKRIQSNFFDNGIYNGRNNDGLWNTAVQTSLSFQAEIKPANNNLQKEYSEPKHNNRFENITTENLLLRNNDQLASYRIESDETHTVQYQINKAANRALNDGKEIPKELIDGICTIKDSNEQLPKKKIDDDNALFGNLKYIGEIFKTYILLESENEIIFIDKHAAHERILYEKLKAGINAFDCQYLLGPITCKLCDEQCEAITDNPNELEKFGFITEDFGRGTILVRSLPFWVQQNEAEGILGEIANSILECKHDLTPEKLDNLYANISCRAAIKANDKNSKLEIETIVDILLKNEKIRYCPHGRPVSTSISKNKLERMFGRQQ